MLKTMPISIILVEKHTPYFWHTPIYPYIGSYPPPRAFNTAGTPLRVLLAGAQSVPDKSVKREKVRKIKVWVK